MESVASDQYIQDLLDRRKYAVDIETGEVYNMSSGERVRTHENRSGYKTVTLSDKKGKTLLLHRVVGVAAYGLETCLGKELHHIDCRKTDNSCYNIVPCTDEQHKEIHSLIEKGRQNRESLPSCLLHYLSWNS